jgi:polyhydroxyalkanoate synthesis regulator phasin
MQASTKHLAATTVLISVLTGGCVTVPQEPPPPPEPKITHTVPTVKARICGSLPQFIENVSALDSESLEVLRDQLGGYEQENFSCDRLKTGLLLGQTGLSISDDNLAMEILEPLQDSGQLQDDEKRLLSTLLYQVSRRKELHMQVHNQRQQIRQQDEALAESRSQADSRAEEISALQHQLEELKKLEDDINATEQSLSTPATDGIENAEPENTDS